MNVPNASHFSNRKPCDFNNLQIFFSSLLEVPIWVASNPKGMPCSLVTGKAAKSSDPNTWSAFSCVEEFCKRDSSFLPAISLQGSDLCILDLDDVRDDVGVIEPWAQSIVDECGSYCEISRSGTGLHIVCRGKKPGRLCKRGKFEIYDGVDAKFITLTGNVLENALEVQVVTDAVLENIYNQYLSHPPSFDGVVRPKSPALANSQILALCSGAKNREKFERLFYMGDIREYSDDDSAADLALMTIFGFYTQNPDQLFEIFRESALYKKPGRAEKWEREDYRNATIRKALSGLKEVYQPRKTESSATPIGSWEAPASIGLGEKLDIEFPLEALPKCMQEAVREVERSIQVDPAMAMIPALGIAALQIGKKVTVVEKEGLFHHPSLFLICVMDQVERKSETNKRILDPIKDIIDQEAAEYKKHKASIEAHNETVTEQINAVKKLIRKEGAENKIADLKHQLERLILSKKESPAPPKNWGDDCTPARLQQNLHIHGGAYGLFSAEGRTILHRILDKNDSEGAVGRSIYTAATWGDSLDRSRVGSGDNGEAEEREVRRPALTITAFVQRDLWTDFARNKTMRSNGTISRICVVNPPSRAGSRLESEHDEPFNAARITPFVDAIIRIRKWSPTSSVHLRLDKEAMRARRDFYNGIESEVGPGGCYEDVRDIAGRACSLTARIAGIFSVIEEADNNRLKDELPPISETLWLRAQALEEYFLAQAIDFQRMGGRSSVDHLLCKTARWLVKHLQKDGPRVLLSQIKRGVRGLEDEAVQTQLIASLQKAGWLRTIEDNKSRGLAYELNAKIADFKGEIDEEK